MSRYIDIYQLLQEIGTSARSASDPWTLSRSYHGTVPRDSFSPPVVADLGAPPELLSSAIQSSEQITRAANVASSPTGGSGSGNPSSGSGFLGGLLGLFPLASGIAKLFGFGSSPSPPALLPYELPPSINFEGATSSATSGVTSLSYDAYGLPRISSTPALNGEINRPVVQNPVMQLSSLATSITSDAGVNNSATNITTQLQAFANSSVAADASMLPASFQQSFPGNSSSPANHEPVTGLNGAPIGSSNSPQGQSVLVQVQAMDSQSFMDHSQEIAHAVRHAMLNMSSLNDVIVDL